MNGRALHLWRMKVPQLATVYITVLGSHLIKLGHFSSSEFVKGRMWTIYLQKFKCGKNVGQAELNNTDMIIFFTWV